MKQEQKHTPGPWRVNGDDRFGYFVAAPSFQGNAYDSVILGDDEYTDDGSPERNKADAHLVAAAPDLLAALKALLELVEMDHESRRIMPDELGVARAAIARAEGQS